MVIDDQHGRAHTLIMPNALASRIVAANRPHTVRESFHRAVPPGD